MAFISRPANIIFTFLASHEELITITAKIKLVMVFSGLRPTTEAIKSIHGLYSNNSFTLSVISEWAYR